MSRSVVVVGAGVIGLCSAYELRQKGFEVTVLDRESEGAWNCSMGNGGMIVPSHFVPLAAPGMVGTGLRMMLSRKSPFSFSRWPDRELIGWALRFMRAANASRAEMAGPLLLALNMASREGYIRYAETFAGDFDLRQTGLLMLCKSQKVLDEEAHLAERARTLGLRTTVLDPAGLARLDPAIRMDVAGGVHFEDDAFLTPEKFMESLSSELASAGVEILHGQPVNGWRSEGRRVVAARTPQGEVTADEFVLAAGADTSLVARGLNLRMPLVSGKGYSLLVQQPPQTPKICAILAEARVAVTPMRHGLRFAGTMELGSANVQVDRHRVAGILESIPRYYPDFAGTDLSQNPVWAGRRPCTPDGLPYLGRPRQWDNLIVATGHAMMGLSLGPVTGEIVSELAARDEHPIPLDMLDPDRYA